MSNQLIKGLPGEPALQGDFVITDTDSVTPLFKVAASGGAVTASGAISGAALNASGDFAVATNKFTVASASGNTVVAGTLSSTGDVTASAGLSVATSFALAGIEAGLIAHAGGTQAAALALNAAKIVHVVATVAAPADSIVLPASAGAGKSHVVMNSGANSLQIYGLATDTINGVAAATGVAIPAGKAAVLVDYAAGTWFMLLGA